MDIDPINLEHMLLDIFVDNHVKPSKDWTDLPAEDLNNEQFKNFKQKLAQSTGSQRITREEEIADGLFINSILTLVHDKYHLERNEYLEFVDSCGTAACEHISKGLPKGSSLPNKMILNRSELSPWQEEYLIYLATIFRSALDLQKNLENRCYIPAEAQRKMGVSLSYKVISEWQRRHIKWQAAAQIFWLDKGANAEKIRKKLLCPELFELLDLGMLPSVDKRPNTAEGEELKFRNLEDVIRRVNPRGIKKGRPSKNALVSQDPVFIPTVYDATSNTLNAEALYIAIDVMAKVLKTQKKSLQQIANHLLICQYKSLSPVLVSIIDVWIMSTSEV